MVLQLLYAPPSSLPEHFAMSVLSLSPPLRAVVLSFHATPSSLPPRSVYSLSPFLSRCSFLSSPPFVLAVFIHASPLLLQCQDGVACQSLPTLKENMKAVKHLKPRGLAALEDVTRLPGREQGHRDLKVGGLSLNYKRVARKSLCRDEFAALTDVEQEAYVYRLAR